MSESFAGSSQTILLLLCGFIVAINLSLVFAFLRRSRDQAELRTRRARGRAPWESKLTDETDELSRRVASLHPPPDSPSPTDKPDTNHS